MKMKMKMFFAETVILQIKHYEKRKNPSILRAKERITSLTLLKTSFYVR